MTLQRNLSHFAHTNVNAELFRHDLASINWDLVYACTNVNEALSLWEKLFNAVVDRHIPRCKRRISFNTPPWFNGEIFSTIAVRDKLHSRALKFSTPENWLSYRSFRNKVVSLMRYYKQSELL